MKINFVNPAFSLRRGISSAVILICAAILASCGKAPEPAAPREAPAAKPSHEFEIEGRVLLTDSPDSSGIQVFIPGSSALAMTDEKGHFLLAGLSPGTKQIRAQRPGYKPARLGEIEIPALSAPKRYVLPDVSMEPEGSVTGETKRGYGQIGGTIQLGSLESTGGETDLSLARVEVEGTPMRTFADKDGYFFFWNVEPGDYRIAVDMPGYPKVHAPISVAAGKEPTLVSINLSEGAFEQEPREITGQVELTDLEDSPVTDYSGVTVFLRELPDRKITVNPDGTFQIGSLAAQSYTL
ncbi:carboxypeptidase regulatory-like domain-containing protein, partial [Candidatus Sumerlaeota bacterium]|nr:carboxypeptidase regulatory-like domain-containing protein [Candidatus Sumerlaeota bacterium]